MNSAEADFAAGNRSINPDSSKDRIREQVQTGLETVKEQIAATGRTIREETLATGRVFREEATTMAGERLEQARLGTADTLARAARGVEGHANDSTSPRYRKAATEVAHRLDDAAQYVRTKTYANAAEDLRADMSAHPGRWICAALSVGFVSGMCLQGFVNRRSNRRLVAD